MKRFLLLLVFATLLFNPATQASYVRNHPYQVTQPDGTLIDCFVSGDEYFNWLHDAEGYTIIQAMDGYYYYGISDKGLVIPSLYVVNTVDPETAGLSKWVKISQAEYNRRKAVYDDGNNRSTRAPHLGTMNNIVVYIKFSGDTEFSTIRQSYDDMFNLPTGTSLKSYFTEVSYTQFTISSTHYPACAMTTNYSYTDTHARNYFEPYNASTNPSGYNGETERRLREHGLLRDAITWINASSPVPTGLNIDGDNDNLVDNVCFIIRGGNGAWASLLWAHRWALYTYNVYINGKQVWDYTFQPESQVDVTTLCHEMFHALGSPDLYHYDDGGLNISPVSAWDLMESGSGHMGAYMKWKYTENSWVTSIPEITASGTYTLQPLTSSTNNCYKIASPNSPTEFFVVEYRKATGTFESSLPGSGLIVYRIDPSLGGNASGPPDEVYIYRPNGTTTTNGSPGSAYYSLASGRTAINDGTNPNSFLQDGSAGGLNIYNITAAGTTISFTVGMSTISNPTAFSALPISGTQINLAWQKNSSDNNVVLAYSTTPTFGIPVTGTAYNAGSVIPGGGNVIYAGNGNAFSHSPLSPATTYYYKLWSVDGTITYSNGINANANTQCGITTLPFSESFSGAEFPPCWTQQVAGTNVAANWSLSATNLAGGASGEMMSTWQDKNPATNRLVAPAMNTTGVTALSLSFRHMLDDYGPGATLRIQSSTNGTTWTNEAWSLPTASNANIGPVLVNTTIASNLNSPTTYLAFTIEGNLYQYDYWYVDDISVTASAYLSFVISTSSSPAIGGNTTGGGTYNSGSQATVTATPATGYVFVNWTENGNVVSPDASYTFTVNTGRILTANFVLQQFLITASANPVEGGSTSGAGNFNYGVQATLNATANTGYLFTNWTENNNVVSTSAGYTFTVSNNRDLIANFTPLQYTIAVSANPAGAGTISGSGSYAFGSQATVTAIANSGWNFMSWTENGNVVSTNAGYSFTVSSSRILVAEFAPMQYTISVSSGPAGGGSSGGGGSYAFGSQATVNAIANSGWIFISWTENGNVVSTDAEYSFTVSGNRTLVANFDPIQYTIAVSSSPAEGGTASGGGLYDFDSQATVTAIANSGWNFVNWTENGNVVSASATWSFTVNGNRTLVANFTQQSVQYTISTASSPATGGSNTGAGTYTAGEQVTVTAIPNIGWIFVNWTENGTQVSNSMSFTFTAASNRDLTANFAQQFNILASANPGSGGYTTGSGTYTEGETAELMAIPNNAFEFLNWTENGNIVSLNPAFSFLVTGNRELIASFMTSVGTISLSTAGIVLYPNPSGGVVTVKSSGTGDALIASVIVVSITGKVLLSIQTPVPAASVIADLMLFPEGLYFFRIMTEMGAETVVKVIVKRQAKEF